MTHLIQPAPVVRGEGGFWYHPDFPEFDGGEVVPSQLWKAWLKDQQLTGEQTIFLEGDAEELFNRYMEGDLDGFTEWQPSKPAGEGWFILCIFDTEDGPYCTWVQRHHDPMFDYINQTYGLKIQKDTVAHFKGRKGRVTKTRAAYVGIVFDDDPIRKVHWCHPTWEVVYEYQEGASPAVEVQL
ncbi:hypothetical protein [Aquirhabdus parva]|uniref:hypothetical protein n=1 Tax=Aquirhabdus parva TaxID=2283318 RepID=UPI001AE354CB|nr:hypothetical protein [Aquirhabdus parva]